MQSKTMSKTHILVECAIMLAISTVLSIFPKFNGLWINGGSVTLCSMLPIIFISYRHGLKWGLAAGFSFSLLQMLGGIYLPAGGLLPAFLGLLLDYILPFTLVGLGGIFRDKIKNPAAALCAGTVVACLLRYASHVASGYVLWRSLGTATEFFSVMGSFGGSVLAGFSGDTLCFIYSVVYNAGYMLPELIITALGAVLLSRFALFGMDHS